jgi:hypothetical protein
MIKLERAKMMKAIERAKAIHPRVKWMGGRTFHVSSSDRTHVYKVQFAVINGQKMGECSCKAGERGMMCFHIAAAASVNIGIQRMRQIQAEPMAA